MVYDTVVLSKDIMVEEKRKEKTKEGKVLYFKLLEDYKSLLDQIKKGISEQFGSEGIQTAEGILLDITKENEILTLQALCSIDKVEQIHSKRIILRSYSSNTSGKNVSLYELLWAAGVEIDSLTLKPILTRDFETSIPGLFYYEQKCAI